MDPKQFNFFKEFCKYEKLTGGPDPHMADVIHMCKDLPLEEQIWRVGLYVGFYNVPTAEAVWSHFPTPPLSGDTLYDFFDKHWDGLRFRRERKSVGLDNTHGRAMVDYCRGPVFTLQNISWLNDAKNFEQIWNFAMGLPHVGRYAATKLCECWERLGMTHVTCTDIRPMGGWSPRKCLAMIYPDTPHDIHGKTDEDIAQAIAMSWGIKNMLPHLSWYELEVMLCEYKASFSSKRQFPGRSLDSELSYEQAINDHWHPDEPLGGTEHMNTRLELRPAWALGEVQGWDPKERLKKLGRVVSTHGYTWSDFKYDYKKTTDFANPVRRHHAS